MKILLIGSGAREHALAWKIRQSSITDELWLWPGSPTLLAHGKRLDIGNDARWEDLARFAKNQGIDFVVVGPEQPLEDGFADACKLLSLPCFGPEQAAARLESSKAFSKEVMAAAGIPTAAFFVVKGETECRKKAVECLQRTGGAVIKASGLASGKGVFVCFDEQSIDDACKRLYYSGMAKAAETVVIEEVLKGRECSFFVFMGEGAPTPLGFAVDHKRLQDGDVGPNTGGMGCYTPVPWLPLDAGDRVMKAVVHPLTAELSKRGLKYTGCLYVGLMWNDDGFAVVEFNARLGDPEAEVLVLHDRRDWTQLIAMKLGLLPDDPQFVNEADQNTGATVCVVLASSCYPYGDTPTGRYVVPRETFANRDTSLCVFAAAVRSERDELVTGKGRMITVVSHAATFSAARAKSYTYIDGLTKDWTGVQFRTDIGAGLES
ncbi:MAG: phosphoribosylamine--glycine ligase [Chitinophagaceae bacterium]|nr:phosphoribosylamine--glycine ligase [Oligoflexus sp.]